MTSPVLIDRVIAHEMVHGLMADNMYAINVPTWFKEGAAEFIHGADERVVGDLTTVAAMTGAMASVATVEVTTAGATRTAGGVAVRAGEAIVLVNGELVASTGSVLSALIDGLGTAGAAEGGLITVYLGRECDADAGAVTEAVGAAFPAAEVECLDGGQPLYPLIASLEP